MRIQTVIYLIHGNAIPAEVYRRIEITEKGSCIITAPSNEMLYIDIDDFVAPDILRVMDCFDHPEEDAPEEHLLAYAKFNSALLYIYNNDEHGEDLHVIIDKVGGE